MFYLYFFTKTMIVGPEEEREPLGSRTFLNHHDVVMMITIEDI